MFVCSVDYSTVGATFQFSTKNSISSLEVVLKGKAIDMTHQKTRNNVDAIIKENNAMNAMIDVRAFEGRLDTSAIYN